MWLNILHWQFCVSEGGGGGDLSVYCIGHFSAVFKVYKCTSQNFSEDSREIRLGKWLFLEAGDPVLKFVIHTTCCQFFLLVMMQLLCKREMFISKHKFHFCYLYRCYLRLNKYHSLLIFTCALCSPCHVINVTFHYIGIPTISGNRDISY